MYPQTIIKVIGIGGAGGNAIHRMRGVNLSGVELIAINTDAQDLKKIKATKKFQIGKKITQGLGAGMNPELGRKAALENKQDLKKLLKGADLVFLTAGLGGGTGGGAIPVLAEIAKLQGSLVIAVVTTPFSFEGALRKRLAERALKELQGKVDALLVIPNDRIQSAIRPETTVLSAFFIADEVLRKAVQGISDLITKPGLINVDFADLKNILRNAGNAVFGVGQGRGENRVEVALESALNSQLLDASLKGAKGVLFNVTGGKNLSLVEVKLIAEKIKEEVDPGAKIIFGAGYDKNLKSDELQITLIATKIPKLSNV